MDAAPSTSTSSNGPQPSSTGPAAEGADTAKMNPENRLILIIIASVIGGVLLLGGLLSLYRRLRYVRMPEQCMSCTVSYRQEQDGVETLS